MLLNTSLNYLHYIVAGNGIKLLKLAGVVDESQGRYIKSPATLKKYSIVQKNFCAKAYSNQKL